ENCQAWRVHTPASFDGVFRPLQKGPGFRFEGLAVGKAQVKMKDGSAVVTGALYSLEKGVTPALPRLEGQYLNVKGPYRARGMLLTEENTLEVLWENQKGE